MTPTCYGEKIVQRILAKVQIWIKWQEKKKACSQYPQLIFSSVLPCTRRSYDKLPSSCRLHYSSFGSLALETGTWRRSNHSRRCSRLSSTFQHTTRPLCQCNLRLPSSPSSSPFSSFLSVFQSLFSSFLILLGVLGPELSDWFACLI